MDYKDKLLDERWIRRKRIILIRDNYACQLCGHKGINDHELHVHHLLYEKGREPWEYNDSELVTLCSDCHEWVHKTKMPLRLRQSRISSRRICEELHDWTKPEDYEGKKLLIKQGTVLTSDEYGYIFVAADYPHYRYFDAYGENHISEIEKSRNVEALLTLNTDKDVLAINEYVFPLDGFHCINARYATEKERERLLDAFELLTKIEL